MLKMQINVVKGLPYDVIFQNCCQFGSKMKIMKKTSHVYLFKERKGLQLIDDVYFR